MMLMTWTKYTRNRNNNTLPVIVQYRRSGFAKSYKQSWYCIGSKYQMMKNLRHHVRNKSRSEDDEKEMNGIRTNISEAQLKSWAAKAMDRCENGDPDIDFCEVPKEDIATFRAALKNKSAIAEAYDRGKWLIGLLILQSSSSFVLDSYQELIKEHLVVTLFLTMLIGAGGNCGNQSAIKIIRGMATGTISPTMESLRSVLRQQTLVALILGTSLSLAGWLRVWLTNGDVLNSCAIALSLFLIVCTSVFVGTILPFLLARASLDPANAGTSIQVVMDCLGVLITCATCHYVLDILSTSLV